MLSIAVVVAVVTSFYDRCSYRLATCQGVSKCGRTLPAETGDPRYGHDIHSYDSDSDCSGSSIIGKAPTTRTPTEEDTGHRRLVTNKKHRKARRPDSRPTSTLALTHVQKELSVCPLRRGDSSGQPWGAADEGNDTNGKAYYAIPKWTRADEQKQQLREHERHDSERFVDGPSVQMSARTIG